MSVFAICHHPCSDGVAGAWVAKQFNPSIEIIFTSRKHEWKKIQNFVDGDFVYFIDFSPYPEDLKSLIDRKIDCMVLDHHETDINQMRSYDAKNNGILAKYCNFDMTKSGCLVAWEYFFKDKPYPKMLEYISIGDTWQWRSEKDHAVVQYIRTLLDADANLKQFEEVLKQFDEEKFATLGLAIHKRITKDASYMAQNYCLMDFDGIEVAAVNATIYHSEVGHELSLKSPSKIGIVYSFTPESDTVKISARGPKSNKFCERYGGGGHSESAGCYMNLDQFNKYLTKARKIDII